MKNSLGALNEYLFAQLDVLSNQDLKGEDLKEEITRSLAVAKLAQSITDNANTVLKAKKTSYEYCEEVPAILEG